MDLLSIFTDHSDDDRDKDLNNDIGGAVATPLVDGERHGDEHKEYFLNSIKSTIVVRQLRSQGLSFQLWPAADTLVRLLDNGDSSSTLQIPRRASSHQLRILELGSGTGLVGIAAAAILRARVTLTDLPHVLSNIRYNAEFNAAVVASRGGSLEVRPLRWGHGEDSESLLAEVAAFDVVLASDVVYYEELIDPLLQTLGDLVKGEETAFVMAHLRRWKKRDAVFFRKARKLFDVSVLHTDPPLPGSRIGVAVYRFTAKTGHQRTLVSTK